MRRPADRQLGISGTFRIRLGDLGRNMTIRELTTAAVTLAGLICVLPIILTLAALFMAWDLFFGQPKPKGDDGWDWAEYE
jgi:hypothetical protein